MRPDGPTPDESRPTISFDLDGILSRPVLGLNVAISRALDLPPPPQPGPGVVDGRVRVKPARLVFDRVRYALRTPMPGAREALARIAERHRPVLVTARGWWMAPTTERWLVRHGLRPFLGAVYTNQGPLPAAAYKLVTLKKLGIDTHLDDDGSIAYYLARHGLPRVYLQDWPRNRGLPYPPSVRVVASLDALYADLARPDQWQSADPESTEGWPGSGSNRQS
jgi:hypothetical protein